MVRVLSPGGRIAVMTTYGRESFLVRKGLELGATICGGRIFDRTTVPAFLSAVGLIDIDQQLRGMSQFVIALPKVSYVNGCDRFQVRTDRRFVGSHWHVQAGSQPDFRRNGRVHPRP